MRNIVVTSLVLLTACGGVGPTEALMGTPTEPSASTTTPTQPETIDLGGAAVRCVSDGIDYEGTYYRVEFRDGGAPEVRVEVVPRPAGLQVDESEAGQPERLLMQTLAGLDPSFRGFESDTMWLALDGEFEGGLAEGRMSRLDIDRESAVPAELRELPVTCFRSGVAQPAHYDSGSGTCLDEADEPAINPWPIRFILATGRGACTRIEGPLNGRSLGYPIFRDLDLAGADLSQAQLHFSSLHRARLEGARLGSLEFGYAIVDGSIDAHTVLPTQMFCDDPISGDHFRCMQ